METNNLMGDKEVINIFNILVSLLASILTILNISISPRFYPLSAFIKQSNSY